MRSWKERVIQLVLVSAATTSILIVALIFLFVGKEAVPFVRDPGLGGLLGSKWAPTSPHGASFGIYPLLTGSLLVTALATVFVVPFGVCGAVYVSEVARGAERELMKPFIEMLAGIPSVVIGFFGLVVLGPALVKSINFFVDRLPGTLAHDWHVQSGLMALTGALLLALMASPTVISISEDALRSVPVAYKEASLALGANRLQTIWKVTVPAAKPGIIAAVMLGMGRVIGETMAVMMCTGNAAAITLSPFRSVRTMTATIAAEMGEVAFGGTHYNALFCVGICLLILTFILNLIAQRALRKHERY